MRKKVQKMSDRWTNLFVDGRRLDRIIRILEKKLKKATEDEKIKLYKPGLCQKLPAYADNTINYQLHNMNWRIKLEK